MAILACLCGHGKRLKAAIFRRRQRGDGQIEEDILISQERQIVFRLETLIAATDNFHDNNKLGQGGFGAVYKVTYLTKVSILRVQKDCRLIAPLKQNTESEH